MDYTEATQYATSAKTVLGQLFAIHDSYVSECGDRSKQAPRDVRDQIAAISQRGLAIYKPFLDLLKTYQEYILDVSLVQWLESQKTACNGLPLFGVSLDDGLLALRSVCEQQAEFLWNVRSHLLDYRRLALYWPSSGIKNQIDTLLNKAKDLITQLVQKTFILADQTHQVIRTTTQNTANICLLGAPNTREEGRKVNFDNPIVKVVLLDENQAKSWWRNPTRIGSLSSNAKLFNSEMPLDVDSGKTLFASVYEKYKVHVEQTAHKNNTQAVYQHPDWNSSVTLFAAMFDKIKITDLKRKRDRQEDNVVLDKYAFLFHTRIAFLDPNQEGSRLEVPLAVLSLPFVIISNDNQRSRAMGTVFWDYAFSRLDRKPFECEKTVKWSWLATMLKNRVLYVLEKELSDEDLRYLAGKVTRNGGLSDYSNHVVSFDQFNCNVLDDVTSPSPAGHPKATFWMWLYSALKVINDHCQSLWKHDSGKKLIHFIGKQLAHDQLRLSTPGTFMIRFSDTAMGHIAYGYTSGPNDVTWVTPMNRNALLLSPLKDHIRVQPNLRYFYGTETNGVLPQKEDFLLPQEGEPQNGQNGQNGHVGYKKFFFVLVEAPEAQPEPQQNGDVAQAPVNPPLWDGMNQNGNPLGLYDEDLLNPPQPAPQLPAYNGTVRQYPLIGGFSPAQSSNSSGSNGYYNGDGQHSVLYTSDDGSSSNPLSPSEVHRYRSGSGSSHASTNRSSPSPWLNQPAASVVSGSTLCESPVELLAPLAEVPSASSNLLNGEDLMIIDINNSHTTLQSDASATNGEVASKELTDLLGLIEEGARDGSETMNEMFSGIGLNNNTSQPLK